MSEAGAARNGGGDRDNFVVCVREFRECLADNFGIGRRRRRGGFTALNLVFAEPVKFVRLFDGRLVAFALFREDMKQDRFILCFQKLKRADEKRNIVAVDRSVVAQAALFENNAWAEKPLAALLHLINKSINGLSGEKIGQATPFALVTRQGTGKRGAAN